MKRAAIAVLKIKERIFGVSKVSRAELTPSFYRTVQFRRVTLDILQRRRFPVYQDILYSNIETSN